MLRKASYAAILAGAVGVPYALFNGEEALQMTGGWFTDGEEDVTATGANAPRTQPTALSPPPAAYPQPYLAENYYDPTAYGPTVGPHGALAASPQPVATGPVMISLPEVLSMDVTHDWVTQRFTRVTTTLADAGYDGLRVPLITGTGETALTGSLTYYFDRGKQLQRITFHGTTGNPQELTALLTQVLQFQPKKCLGGELYTRGWLNRTNSVCRIRPAGVLHAGAQSTRYEVLLEMNRGQWKSSLSPTAKQLLN